MGKENGITEEHIKIQSVRMLKDALFFINSIGKQDEFLNYVPKADEDLYLEIWD